MAYDTTIPTKTQAWDGASGWLAGLRANILAVAMMLDPTDAGAVSTPVAGIRRFNKTSGYQERYSGSAWGTETVNISGTAAKATQLATARTISATGDATWTVTFSGSGNVTAALTLAGSGVTAGTYRSVTVDAKGRVTGGTNPTTLAGYAISDAYTKTATDSLLAAKAPLASPALTGTPTAPTATAGTSTTQLATTAFVTGALTGYAALSGAPTFAGLVRARGGGLGLGRISVTTTTGTPSGMSAGDLVLVF